MEKVKTASVQSCSSAICRAAGTRPGGRPPPTEEGRLVVVVASSSETLIFINDLGSHHLQLISASILREIVCAAHPCAGTVSIQLSHHLNLIFSSREALYGLMGSRNTQLEQESAQGLQLQLRVTTTADTCLHPQEEQAGVCCWTPAAGKRQGQEDLLGCDKTGKQADAQPAPMLITCV